MCEKFGGSFLGATVAQFRCRDDADADCLRAVEFPGAPVPSLPVRNEPIKPLPPRKAPFWIVTSERKLPLMASVPSTMSVVPSAVQVSLPPPSFSKTPLLDMLLEKVPSKS